MRTAVSLTCLMSRPRSGPQGTVVRTTSGTSRETRVSVTLSVLHLAIADGFDLTSIRYMPRHSGEVHVVCECLTCITIFSAALAYRIRSSAQ